MIIPLINPHPALSKEQLKFRVSQAKLARFYRQAIRKGKLKKTNPNRPPREWFYKKVAELSKSGRYADPKKLAGYIWYHHTGEKRKKEILKEEKRPATSRGLSHKPGLKVGTKKESVMVYSLKKSPRRRRAHGRRRLAKRRNPKFGIHRPTLLWAGKWYRRKRSKLIKKGTRINPKRSHKRASHVAHRFHRYRRNPAIPFNMINVVIGGAKIAGGIAVGAMLMPVFTMVMPKDLTAKFGKFYGVLHVVIGAIAAAMVKNKMVKDAALVVAGTGVYDLIASNVEMLGLPTLPRSSPLIPTKGLGEDPGVIGSSYQAVGADYAPALGASYQEVGADDIAYGDDGNFEIG